MTRPPVTLEELRTALATVAELVMLDSVYAPVFERIERELKSVEQQDEITMRARAVLACYKAIG